MGSRGWEWGRIKKRTAVRLLEGSEGGGGKGAAGEGGDGGGGGDAAEGEHFGGWVCGCRRGGGTEVVACGGCINAERRER